MKLGCFGTLNCSNPAVENEVVSRFTLRDERPMIFRCRINFRAAWQSLCWQDVGLERSFDAVRVESTDFYSTNSVPRHLMFIATDDVTRIFLLS